MPTGSHEPPKQSVHCSAGPPKSQSQLSLYYETGNVTTIRKRIVTIQRRPPMNELKRKKLEKIFAWIDRWSRDQPEEWESGSTPEEVKELYEAKALDVGRELVMLKDFLNQDGQWHVSREETDGL